MLVQLLTPYKHYLFLKFQKMVTASSLSSADFVILDEDDNEVANALQPLDVGRDYNSIQRSVHLYFSTGMEPDTQYKLRIDGVENIFGEEYDPVTVEFTTRSDTGTVTVEPLEPTFYVDDYTVADVPFTGTGGGGESESATPSDELEFVGSVPTNNSIFNEATDGEYQVQLSFSEGVLQPGLASFFTVQKRKLAYTYTQWEDIELTEEIAVSSPDSNVILRIPVEEEENYKYRIIINKALRNSDDDLSLGEDVIVSFTNSLTPFYSNPEEIIGFYPETTELEAAELIHRYSLEAKTMMGYNDDADPHFVVVEYVTAAVLCRLAMQAGDVMGANGNADDVTLGDFRVSKKVGGTGNSTSRATRESATNWCELAAAIKREMRSKNRLPRTFVRGSRHKNPIPSRYFKDLHTFKNRNSPYDYGLINDN